MPLTREGLNSIIESGRIIGESIGKIRDRDLREKLMEQQEQIRAAAELREDRKLTLEEKEYGLREEAMTGKTAQTIKDLNDQISGAVASLRKRDIALQERRLALEEKKFGADVLLADSEQSRRLGIAQTDLEIMRLKLAKEKYKTGVSDEYTSENGFKYRKGDEARLREMRSDIEKSQSNVTKDVAVTDYLSPGFLDLISPVAKVKPGGFLSVNDPSAEEYKKGLTDVLRGESADVSSIQDIKTRNFIKSQIKEKQIEALQEEKKKVIARVQKAYGVSYEVASDAAVKILMPVLMTNVRAQRKVKTDEDGNVISEDTKEKKFTIQLTLPAGKVQNYFDVKDQHTRDLLEEAHRQMGTTQQLSSEFKEGKENVLAIDQPDPNKKVLAGEAAEPSREKLRAYSMKAERQLDSAINAESDLDSLKSMLNAIIADKEHPQQDKDFIQKKIVARINKIKGQ